MKGIAFLCFLVFLNSALVLCRQNGIQNLRIKRSLSGRSCLLCCGRNPPQTTALKNLLGPGTAETYMIASFKCRTLAAPPESVQADPNIRDVEFTVKGSCRVGLDRNNELQVNLITQGEPEVEPEVGAYHFVQCPGQNLPAHAYDALYLSFLPNKNTYMILDPAVATWFFTDHLSGCDVFIATSASAEHSKKPLIIHSNKNRALCDDPKVNKEANRLKEKGQEADQIIWSHRCYTLKTRVYGEDRDATGVNAEVTAYQNTHVGVHLHYYDAGEGRFIF